MNERVNRATWKNATMSWVPSKRTNTTFMLIIISPNLLKFVCIPQVHLSTRSSYCQNRARAMHPGNWSYYFSIVFGIKYLFNISCLSVPQVHSLGKAYCKSVILAPIKKVKVIVIYYVGSIKYLLWELRNASESLLLFLCFFLSKSLYQWYILMKRHRRAGSLFFERQNSLIRGIILLQYTLLAISDPREPQLFLLSLLKSKSVRWASLASEHTLSHQFLETLLFLMTGAQRILSRWIIRGATILNSIYCVLTGCPWLVLLAVNTSASIILSWGQVGGTTRGRVKVVNMRDFSIRVYLWRKKGTVVTLIHICRLSRSC